MVIVTSHPSGQRRLRCAGRAQGNGCDAPSCFAHVVEDQIGELLKAFAVPPERQDALMALWRRYADRAPNTRAERAKIERRLGRLRDLYLDGDVDKGEYQAQRAKLTDQLATLPTDDDRTDTLGQRLAVFLANLSAAWTVATAEERNQLARQLFAQVVIANRTAVAVVPRPDLRPFFHLVAVNPPEEVAYGGSDGGRFITFNTPCPSGGRSASPFPTSGRASRPAPVGRPGQRMNRRAPGAIMLALAS